MSCQDPHHCITCGDDGVPMRVLRVDEARGLALCEDEQGGRSSVEIALVAPVAPGDVLHFVTWGGGGWGDPLARDPSLVAKEVRRGLVTAAGARRYGVITSLNGELDADATEALREELRAGRPPELPVFDMGPGLEEILARCEEETGLPAPTRPVWT